MKDLVTLAIKIPRDTEVTPEAAQTFLTTLTQLNSGKRLQKLMGKFPKSLSLEIAFVRSQIYFLISIDPEFEVFVRKKQ